MKAKEKRRKAAAKSTRKRKNNADYTRSEYNQTLPGLKKIRESDDIETILKKMRHNFAVFKKHGC